MFKHDMAVFYNFLRRDIYTYSKLLKDLFIDECAIKPVQFAFCYGYLLPKAAGMIHTTGSILDLFVGVLLWSLIPLGFHLTMGIMFDFEGDQYIKYEAMILRPSLVVLEKIFFFGTLCFLILTLFYPISFTILGYGSLIFEINWFKLIILLYISSILSVSYMVFAMMYLSGLKSFENFWLRYNLPLMMLGGGLAPFYVMNKYSPTLGRISLLNPFLYVTEGAKSIILKGNFLSFNICISVMIVYTVIFAVLAIIYFKKRIDHI